MKRKCQFYSPMTLWQQRNARMFLLRGKRYMIQLSLDMALTLDNYTMSNIANHIRCIAWIDSQIRELNKRLS